MGGTCPLSTNYDATGRRVDTGRRFRRIEEPRGYTIGLVGQTLQIQVEQVGPSTSKATARSHEVFIDRPTAKGGADRGPPGGEYLLIAWGGCFMSHLLDPRERSTT